MKSERKARDIYDRFLISQSEPFGTFKQLAELMRYDLSVIWGIKLNSHGDKNTYEDLLDLIRNPSRFIGSVFAAEIFADRTPPKYLFLTTK